MFVQPEYTRSQALGYARLALKAAEERGIIKLEAIPHIMQEMYEMMNTLTKEEAEGRGNQFKHSDMYKEVVQLYEKKTEKKKNND